MENGWKRFSLPRDSIGLFPGGFGFSAICSNELVAFVVAAACRSWAMSSWIASGLNELFLVNKLRTGSSCEFRDGLKLRPEMLNYSLSLLSQKIILLHSFNINVYKLINSVYNNQFTLYIIMSICFEEVDWPTWWWNSAFTSLKRNFTNHLII